MNKIIVRFTIMLLSLGIIYFLSNLESSYKKQITIGVLIAIVFVVIEIYIKLNITLRIQKLKKTNTSSHEQINSVATKKVGNDENKIFLQIALLVGLGFNFIGGWPFVHTTFLEFFLNFLIGISTWTFINITQLIIFQNE